MSNTSSQAPTSLISGPTARTSPVFTGVDLRGIQVSHIAPLPAGMVESMQTETDPVILGTNLQQHYYLCLALVHVSRITPHTFQRTLVPHHVERLQVMYSNTGADLLKPANYGYAVALGDNWAELCQLSTNAIVIHEDSDLEVECLAGGHRVAAQKLWCETNQKPDKLYWKMYIYRPGE